MGEVLGNELPPAVINHLRGGRIVIVATVDREGRPNSAPFAWAVAKDMRRIRIGINKGVATLDNIKHNGGVSITISAPELFVTLKGTGRVIRDVIEDAPVPTSVVEVTIDEVKDDGVIGRVLPGQERTRWTERRRLMSDTTILSALVKD